MPEVFFSEGGGIKRAVRYKIQTKGGWKKGDNKWYSWKLGRDPSTPVEAVSKADLALQNLITIPGSTIANGSNLKAVWAEFSEHQDNQHNDCQYSNNPHSDI